MNEYRDAVKRNSTARLVITLLLLAVILVNVGLMWGAFNGLKANRVKFADALACEVRGLAPGVAEQVRNMLDRLTPVYMEALQTRYEIEKPALDREVNEQLARLDGYVQSRWPEIQHRIGEMALVQESIIRGFLTDVVEPDEAQRISEVYGEALVGKFNRMMTNDMHEHVAVAHDIGRNLNTMIETAPPAQKPVELGEIVGVALELAGVQLQQSLN